MNEEVRGYKGSLDIYFQIEDSDGNFGDAIYDGGNATDFQITPQSDLVEIPSTGNDDYGQSLESMSEAKPTQFSLTVNRMSIQHWAIAFMASITARSASATTITDKAISAVQNQLFYVGANDVSNFDITDDTDTTTYVLGTDYEIVDAALGIVKWLAADADILVSCDVAAETGKKLSGGSDTSKVLRIFGRGTNKFTGKRTLVNIGRGTVTADGGFPFVGDAPAELKFSGTANIPSDGSAAFDLIVEE